MQIIVDSLPNTERDCLFSYWDKHWWLCKLYKSTRHGSHYEGLKNPICKCGDLCPYLREESWFGIKDE